MQEKDKEKKTLQFLIFVCSAALILSLAAMLVSIYNQIIAYQIRVEQLKRTKHVYDVSVIQEVLKSNEQTDRLQWKEIDKLRLQVQSTEQSTEIKQQ